jgi:UPF0755 protein
VTGGEPPDRGRDDPFFDDDRAAQERERRRLERERRRAQRGSLGERVGEVVGAGENAPSQPPPPPPPTAPPPPATPPPRRPPAGTSWRGRLLALVAVMGAVALAGVGVAAMLDGDDEGAPVKQRRTLSVTIPEGYTRAEIAAIAEEAELRGDYAKATREFRGFDPKDYGAEGDPDSLEGFLFPATYELFQNAKVEELVAKQLDAFEQRIEQVNMRYAESRNLTVYDVLIIASMIEKEVLVPKERELVAAVIYNRLRQDIGLGIDATIRYATGNYDEPLTDEDLAIDSPYNTRTNIGLPPAPIGNPGLDSIEAAAHPADVPYIYFVVKPGTCGEHVFTDSEAEFLEAEARYNEAREEAGGRSPTEC